VVVSVGFLGAGLIASYHARSLGQSGAAAALAVVHDPAAERAAAFARRFGARVAADEDEVLDTVDAVYVCTWTSAHARLVEAACARRLAVFCEKPLAPDLAGAEAMAAAVDAAGVTNQVGLVLRATPGFRLLRALIRDPAVGRVVSVTFRDDQQLPVGGYYGSHWRIDRSRAGSGTLLEHSIHDLDILEWLVGPVGRLSAVSANVHGHPGIEDTVALSFGLLGGGTGVLTSVWHDLPGRLSDRRLEVFCERGRCWAEGNLAEVVGWEHQPGRSEQRSGPGLSEELQRRGEPPPGNPDAAFLEAVAAGSAAFPDFPVAVRAHRLVDAAYRSAASGGDPVDCSP
jgi:myo-inositol 2-dehydrogenase/D-chiro-inositol 1-dehydrogenase